MHSTDPRSGCRGGLFLLIHLSGTLLPRREIPRRKQVRLLLIQHGNQALQLIRQRFAPPKLTRPRSGI